MLLVTSVQDRTASDALGAGKRNASSEPAGGRRQPNPCDVMESTPMTAPFYNRMLPPSTVSGEYRRSVSCITKEMCGKRPKGQKYAASKPI